MKPIHHRIRKFQDLSYVKNAKKMEQWNIPQFLTVINCCKNKKLLSIKAH